VIEILEPGLLTTVQDLGRPGLAHLGVPPSGAADAWSLRVANVLAGNPPGAAALEVTGAGPRLLARRNVTIAVAGADLGATVAGLPLAPGRSAVLEAGAELHLPGPPREGLRAYVAVSGGIDVPVVLGARSTCLPGGFGGLGGRALEPGDLLGIGRAPAGAPVGDAWPGPAAAARRAGPGGEVVLRWLPGPAGSEGLTGRTWTVSVSSDRTGLRLDAGADGPEATSGRAGLPSHAVVQGTVQLPPDGHPIVLGPDHQTTGGYPVVGFVIAADLPALGQLPPLARVAFEQVELDRARHVLAQQRLAWNVALDLVRRDAGWDELAMSAGG
jgi:antagonist of KipI